jgi:hypothetical protein
MKKLIENLKKTTGIRSDAKFAAWLGFSKNTIAHAKLGRRTKLIVFLPMLDYLLKNMSGRELDKFLKAFASSSEKYEQLSYLEKTRKKRSDKPNFKVKKSALFDKLSNKKAQK